jgi:hypothetical protein
MYLMTATRNGVSAKELQRQLGVTYKCAWRIGHQLRILMKARADAQNPGPLSGHVELDETYIGGKERVRGLGLGKGNYLRNKAVVFGLVQRDGPLKGYVMTMRGSTTTSTNGFAVTFIRTQSRASVAPEARNQEHPRCRVPQAPTKIRGRVRLPL